MKAAVLWEPGTAFDVTDVEIAEPPAGWVRVDLKASGVCASDLSLTTRFGQPTPVVLGHEGAGVVSAVGASVTAVAPGDRVLVLWVAPCGECEACRRGDEHLCERRRSSADARSGAAGARTDQLSIDGRPVHQGMLTATFAQQTIVPANAVLAIDDDVPFPIAALMGCAVPTGVGAAIRSAGVQPGDRVAVIGCGGVGLSAVMGAVVAGAADLVAVDPMASRRRKALELGATAAIAPDEVDGLPRLDVVVDAVGAPQTVASAWRAVRRGGTVTVVGAGRPDEVARISAYELFHDDKRLTGSFHGGMSLRRELPVLTRLWRTGRLPLERLITRTAPLDDINEVVRAQQAGEAVRVMMVDA